MMLNRMLLCCVLLPLISAGPTLYKLDKEKNTAERVMIAVSSTGVFRVNQFLVGGWELELNIWEEANLIYLNYSLN
jgi:hypothetical protein